MKNWIIALGSASALAIAWSPSSGTWFGDEARTVGVTASGAPAFAPGTAVHRTFHVPDPGDGNTAPVFTVPADKKFVIQRMDMDIRAPYPVGYLGLRVETPAGGTFDVLRPSMDGRERLLSTNPNTEPRHSWDFRFGFVVGPGETLSVVNYRLPGTRVTDANLLLSGVFVPASTHPESHILTIDNAEAPVYQQPAGTKGVLTAYGIGEANILLQGSGGGLAEVTIRDATGRILFKLPSIPQGHDWQAVPSWVVLQPGWSVWVKDWTGGPPHSAWCTVLSM